ncbi:TonB-dependent receptor plug domain-containing protein [Reichenbachiella versicolor]|uniref:TonB-dependent receptor plug domain-containing protein n=1 Tax=Reichenbachiella versicolor TaxID=1821036 RepID=UPI0013A55850|nr:TonB-dependent receptor plug domain-containing protein [Reichenbachiella versicolor]
MKVLIPTLILTFCLSQVYAQDDSGEDSNDFLELSLESLMDIKIVSASRKEEDSFDAPISSFVISKQEIELYGATNIPEALRLCPGVIVREISNGTYDVSLRGGVDGFPPYVFKYTNFTILLMIDNRPVYDRMEGGVYWQNLPINITDVERIEIVHGPVAPLYGPNAVSGVINIITTRPEGQEMSTSVNAAFGPFIEQMSTTISKNLNDKFSAQVGLGYESRERYDEKYYDPSTGEYVLLDSISALESLKEARYPEPNLNLRRFSGNIDLFYDIEEDVKLRFGLGVNRSTGLNPLSLDLGISTHTNDSKNFNLSGVVKNFSFVAAHLSGVQGVLGNDRSRHFNYKNTDIYVDYSLKTLKDKLIIRPAVSYQSSFIDDREFSVDKEINGILSGKASLNNIAGSLKLEATPTDKIRVVLVGRYDRFNYPDDGVFAYQGVLNYKLAENHLLRILTGKSYNGSFIIRTLVNTDDPLAGSRGNFRFMGSKDLDLLSNTMYEVGYRTKFNENMVFDVAFFSQRFTDFSTAIFQTPQFDPATGLTLSMIYENLPLEVEQVGTTVSFQANLFENKLQIRPHMTWQATEAKNFSPNDNVEGARDNPETGTVFEGHKNNTTDIDSEFTPSVWGGVNIISNPAKGLSISLSSYYYDSYKLNSLSEVDSDTGNISDFDGNKIKSKLRLNAYVSYSFFQSLKVFANCVNLTDQTAAESFGSDKLGRSFMIGLNLRY